MDSLNDLSFIVGFIRWTIATGVLQHFELAQLEWAARKQRLQRATEQAYEYFSHFIQDGLMAERLWQPEFALDSLLELLFTLPTQFLAVFYFVGLDATEVLEAEADRQALEKLLEEFTVFFLMPRPLKEKTRGLWHLDMLFDCRSYDIDGHPTGVLNLHAKHAVHCLTKASKLVGPEEGRVALVALYLAGAYVECLTWSQCFALDWADPTNGSFLRV